MNRKILKTIFAIFWIAIFVLLSGCGSKPAGPENDNIPFEITIDQIHDVYLGHFTEVSIKYTGKFSQVTSLDIKIAYDPAFVDFAGITAGGLLANHEWQHFSCEQIFSIDTGSIQKPPMIHIIAHKDNELDSKTLQNSSNDPGTIAELSFIVRGNPNNFHTYSPIRFYWDDCYDNLLYTDFPDSAICVASVFDSGQLVWSHNLDESGIGTVPSICGEDSQISFSPLLKFSNGGCNFAGDTTIYGARGDININGLPFEIADLVMFTHFLSSGLSAFGSHIDSSITASDANNNGIPLEVADLDYMLRLIQGDTLYTPYFPGSEPVEITHHVDGDQNSIFYNSPYDLSVIFLEIESTEHISRITLIDNAIEMNIGSSRVGNLSRILVYSTSNEKITDGSGGVVSFESSGEVKLNSVTISRYSGGIVSANIIKTEGPLE